MDGAKLSSFRIRKRRIGGKKISAEPGIGIVAPSGAPFAIGALVVIPRPSWKDFADRSAVQRGWMPPEDLRKALIAFDDAVFRVVHQNGVTDGVKRVRPLLLGCRHLLKEVHVQKGKAQ